MKLFSHPHDWRQVSSGARAGMWRYSDGVLTILLMPEVSDADRSAAVARSWLHSAWFAEWLEIARA